MLLFDKLGCFKAVHDWHFNVHENEIDFGVVLNKFHGFPSVFGAEDGDVFAFKVLVQQDGT